MKKNFRVPQELWNSRLNLVIERSDVNRKMSYLEER